MPSNVVPLLVFDGRAEEAMGFYVTTFEDSGIDQIHRYCPGGVGAEGTVEHADFHLCGQRMSCIDSPVQQPFTFTPAISLMVELGEHLVDETFEHLAAGGSILVPLGAYGYHGQVGWVTDRFGVSWQLQVPESPVI